MKSFVFHSVRPQLAIPPAHLWPDASIHAGFFEHMTVEPGWFIEWCKSAKGYWGDNLHITFDDAFRDILVPAIWAVQRMEIATTVFVPTAHMGQVFPGTPYDVMDGSEIAYMHGQGVNIGSHSHRHEDHRYLYGQTLGAHCWMSGQILKGLTGVAPNDIALPHGHFRPEFVPIAESEGYERVWGTNLYPAGRHGSLARCLAGMSGYVDELGVDQEWEWET